jgi:PAS domain S-box-containing protein
MEDILFLLVVDDNEQDRIAIIDSLENLGAKIVEAKSGRECLEALDASEFDCILLDHLLPDYSSEDIISAIKHKNETTPIIIITNQGDDILALTLLKLGAMDYIPKQKIGEDTLANAVRNAVRLKATEQKKEFYKSFYETAPIGFYTTSIKDGTFLMANPVCVEMLGFKTFEEMKDNVRASDFYPKYERQRLLDGIEKYGRVTDFETKITLLDGRELWVQVSGRYCRSGDCIEGSLTDITEKLAMKEELEEYKVKGLAELQEMERAIKMKLKEYDKGCEPAA